MAVMISKRKIEKIACIGEVMIELFMGDDDRADVGVAGDTYNTAVYLARLLERQEKTVSYVTALGTDKFSERILAQMKERGIDGTYVEKRPDLTPGLYAIDTDDSGERSFSYWRSQAAARTLFKEPCALKLEALNEFDLIYVSGITMAILPLATRGMLITFLKSFSAEGGYCVYDSNYRPRLWENIETARSVTMEMWNAADIALPSLDDEMDLFDETNESQTVERLRKAGVGYGALKRAATGPLNLSDDEIELSYPVVTNVVDTTAAGDSFNAGFIAALALGKPLEIALVESHELASKVIQAKGAIVDF
jgi:2-dehydro-3-deoxygluconokinase